VLHTIFAAIVAREDLFGVKETAFTQQLALAKTAVLKHVVQRNIFTAPIVCVAHLTMWVIILAYVEFAELRVDTNSTL